jgi:hypothetical protein
MVDGHIEDEKDDDDDEDDASKLSHS